MPPEAPTLPKYLVDFDVRTKTGFLGKKPKFERRQFVLTGQTLEVHHEGNTTHSFIARDVTIELLSGFLYRLKGKPWQRLVVSIPSASRVDRFRQVLSLAAKTPHWTLPPSDVMTSLLQVATEIIESKCALPPPPNPHVRLYSPDRLHLAISTVTVGQVQAHLAEMFAMYEFQGKCTSMGEVYSRLVDLEVEYVANRRVNNFAHTVHRLHPVQYMDSKPRPYYPPPVFKSAKEMFSKCPYADCEHDLPVESIYKSHVKGETLTCGQCQKKISPAAFRIAAFIKDAPQFHIKFNLNKTATTITVVTPPVPEDGRIKTFMEELTARMREQAPQANQWGVQDLRFQVYTEVSKHFNQPHLDLVLAMLRQLDFVNKICAHMEYWNNPTVIQASIIRYHKFMNNNLFKFNKPRAVLVPTSDIDLVWHTHQADDSNYRAFCRTHSCQVIDHDDTIKSDALERSFEETYHQWLNSFGDFYSSYLPTSSGERRTEDNIQVPSHDCRFVGVNEPFAVEALPYATAVIPDKLAVDNAKTPPPNNLTVYLTVIGTPVMDGRVRLKYSRQSYLMGQGHLGYVNFDASQGDTKCGCVGNYGYGQATGTGGCATAGCGSGGCGGGGCGSGGGGGDDGGGCCCGGGCGCGCGGCGGCGG